MDPLRKNLLDLRHSYFMAKGNTFLALAFGFPATVFVSLRENLLLAGLAALLLFFIFFKKSKTYFLNSMKIQKEIEGAIR